MMASLLQEQNFININLRTLHSLNTQAVEFRIKPFKPKRYRVNHDSNIYVFHEGDSSVVFRCRVGIVLNTCWPLSCHWVMATPFKNAWTIATTLATNCAANPAVQS